MSVTTPTRNTDAVVRWLIGPDHLCAGDTDGRPLGEHGAPSLRGTAQADAEAERRTFGDSRDATRLECNVGALRQMSCVWRSMLDALSALDCEHPSTGGRVLRRVSAATALAPLLAVRGKGAPFEREAAALFKVTLGFTELCTVQALRGRLDVEAPPPCADTILRWLDEEPWLIGRTQVCAGSRRQIRQIWEALCDSADAPFARQAPWAVAWTSEWFQVARAALDEIGALAGAAAAAAKLLLRHGGPSTSTSAQLYAAASAPRIVGAVRRVEEAGPLHIALRYERANTPAGLLAFFRSLQSSVATLEEVDAAWIEAARPAALRLMRALGHPTPPAMTLSAFAVERL